MTLYTFSGYQSYNPFSIDVVATSEEEARKVVLTAINHVISPNPNVESLAVDLHIGCYCKGIKDFNQKIFNDPNQLPHQISRFVNFTDWIKSVKCTSRPFVNEVRIYSCLDG